MKSIAIPTALSLALIGLGSTPRAVRAAEPQARMLVAHATLTGQHHYEAEELRTNDAVAECVQARCEGFLWDSPVPGTVPLFVLQRAKGGARIYTALAERRSAELERGSTDLGILGYVSAEATLRTRPLYRLKSISSPAVLHTTDSRFALDPPEGFVLRGVVAHLLEPTEQPNYFHVQEPHPGTFDLEPDGTIMIIHGGGWQNVGVSAATNPFVEEIVERWRARGWRTVAITHRRSAEGPIPRDFFPVPSPPITADPGSASFSIEDTLALYDSLRAWLGAGETICVGGFSAGGHLALTVATRRSDVACVITQGAPTHLPSLLDSPTPRPLTAGFADFAFGPTLVRDPAFSPALSATEIGDDTWVLLGNVTSDPFVPVTQMQSMVTARPKRTLSLELAEYSDPDDKHFFVHGYTSAEEITAFHELEEFVERQVARGSGVCTSLPRECTDERSRPPRRKHDKRREESRER